MNQRYDSARVNLTRMVDRDLPLVIDDLMAGGMLLPAQLPSPSLWSAEKRMAAAVLASALNDARYRPDKASHRRRVNEALQWIRSDDAEWPFSFLRLCALFDLDPEWVRAAVNRSIDPASRRRRANYRHAA
jgi:hypothetical protein